jgi:hypothetical protein
MINRLCTLLAETKRRSAVTWLAIVALLFHALLPAGLLIGTSLRNQPGGAAKFALCSADSDSDLPGKVKPGLPAHDCSLCTAPATELSPPATGPIASPEIAAAVYPRRDTDWKPLLARRGRVQARAPPALA